MRFRYVGLVDITDAQTLADWKGVGDIPRFIQQVSIGLQGERYAIALMSEGHVIRKIEYRLICRPTIKYKLPKFTWAVLKEGNKNAIKVFDNEVEAIRLKITRQDKDPVGVYSVKKRTSGNPTRQHYEDECVAWLNDLEHGERVKSHPHYVNEYKLLKAQWSIHDAAKHILYCRRNDRWATNDRVCFHHNKPCRYMDICIALQNGHNVENLIAQEFQPGKRNPELFNYDLGIGLPVLTHSMISDLHFCNAFFYWRYERCIEKQSTEDSEPLWVGSAMHVALDTLNKTNSFDDAFAAIDKWAADNPLSGEDAEWVQDQQVARARAMVRVAAERWLPTVGTSETTLVEADKR